MKEKIGTDGPLHLQAGAIVLAAGYSRRFGEDKLFMSLGSKPVLAWSIDVLQRCEAISQIILILNENNISAGHELASRMHWSKLKRICPGGKRRQDSVQKGLKAASELPWILIHDGARPFLTEDIIYRGLKAAQKSGAAIAAVPVKDTIKMSDSHNFVTRTLDRNLLWSVQTPQIFRSDIIVHAYEHNDEDVTDDASLVERLKHKVQLYMGSYNNIKITTSDDILLAENIARTL